MTEATVKYKVKENLDEMAILYLPENELGTLDFVPVGSIVIPIGTKEDGQMRLLTLNTGSNLVSKEQWNTAKTNRIVQSKLEKDVLIEIEPTAKVEPDSLDSYKANDAKRLINATNRISQLELWLTKTKNQTIYNHINSRIRTLKQGL